LLFDHKLSRKKGVFTRGKTMKDSIHPNYHEITVVMTDGSEFVTRSTYGKAGDKLHLDIDPKTHPAWTGVHRLVDRGGQLAKFNRRFAGISGTKDEGSAKPAAVEPKIKLTTSASTIKQNSKKEGKKA
jgi:large subunit ribosomal protein L31